MASDLAVTKDGHVALLEMQRPPLNFFDLQLITDIADALEVIDADPEIRSVVLAAQGKAFCAGADFSSGENELGGQQPPPPVHLYVEATRIFGNKKPIVAAVHGAAIGGGFGLAMAADFRVTCPEARFSANFTRLGFHPGFGLTVTLPEAIGKTNAELMFYTSRRVTGEQALAMGLASALVPADQVRSAALALAREIAECSPLGLLSTRKTMRGNLAQRVKAATDHELIEQEWLRKTQDFSEGVRSTADRRAANFIGA
ncbi:MAG: enoyl-CoA hydratase/isomerase family protein [Phenylobacterium sp.]|uniref:enoyl-CoA hydratase/isomerase family protein n=1 Tax=Phenylobacterium sp. TaxID=1871053 RepID=UPI002735797C|nr:enoyl-CoA hydratase/isomerase family protein [Phenylobacterium sp.]MDP3173060.1 enoyl-CoA hydratase/isomerase family protein [Phenylobacterium sp.]